ncbi:MarR family winged helix-turn-helix transcriptional regulator [Sphingomonas sp. TX0543]|uniref:MarR family winged helix-turn-helix transcriptional regulator n=1 Tax=unclassified Sphingomonas TaxID=196159 RepID=UPI0020162499|nr:MarR family transcriptional regulator [Sphingomonas sp. 3P27F8]
MKSDDQLIKNLASAYLQIHRRLNRALTQQGASLTRTKMLLFIRARQGAARAADIAELFDLAPRTVTEALDGMERDALIARAADPDDRRVKRIAITAAGARMLEATEPLRQKVLSAQLTALSDEEHAQLTCLLGRLVESLDEA